MKKALLAAISFALVSGLPAVPARAVFIGNSQGGTDFPAGAVSFADSVVNFSPTILGGEPTEPNRNATNALGVPNYSSGGPCSSPETCTFVSLGDGGSLTLRFTDNVLTGSDSPALDLWIFEVGPDVEDTFVEISTNGSTWFPVGKVFGSTAGIDIDAFGFGSSNSFSYIRLTDDTAEGDQTGASVGADIDAVGAISTRVVPEPGTWLLVLCGLATFVAFPR
jgi:hypothetical protein